MNRSFSIILAMVFAFTLIPATAFGDVASDAAQRIKDRLVQVDALKAAGDVGEDVRGYLSKRKELGPRQNSIVDAENADRLILYKTVAGRANQSVEEVGEQRAIQIATRARPGVWLQKPGGEWYQKS